MQHKFNIPFQHPPSVTQQQPTAIADFKTWLSVQNDAVATKFSQALFYWSEHNGSLDLDRYLFAASLDFHERLQISSILKNYNLSLLGGMNSRNFLLENKYTGHKEVLKLEYRFGNPLNQVKIVEEKLKAGAYANTITSTAAEKNVRIFNTAKRDWETRTLLVTEYCPGSDLNTMALHCKNIPEVLSYAGSIYTQMSGFLVELEKNASAHPDMKNSNWLLDDKGNLRVADTKAIIPTQEDGLISPKLTYQIIRSVEISPPELLNFNPNPESTDPGFNAGKAESFMLGKNLYGFLTASHYNNPCIADRIMDADELDFTAPIFQTLEGLRYKLLIQNTVLPDDTMRMTLDEIQLAMQAIQTLKNQDANSRAEQCFAAYDEFEKHLQNYPGLQNQSDLFLEKFYNPCLDSDGLTMLLSDMQKLNQSIRTYETRYDSLMKLHPQNSLVERKLLPIHEGIKTNPELSTEQFDIASLQLDKIKQDFRPEVPKRMDLSKTQDMKSRLSVVIGKHRGATSANADLEVENISNQNNKPT